MVHLGMGQLTVELIGCADLASHGRSLFNPFCVVRVDKQVVQTEVIEKTIHPSWNALLFFEVSDSSRAEIVVKHHKGRSSQVLGAIVYPVRDLLSDKGDQMKELWLPLQPIVAGDAAAGSSGRIHLRLRYQPSIGIPARQLAQSDFFLPTEDGWVQEPISRELWVENPPRPSKGLIDVAAAASHGMHVEHCRACVTSYEKDTGRELFDTQHNAFFYSHMLYGTDHVVYFGTDPSIGPVVVAVGSPDESNLRKVAVWTKREEKRFVVPNMVGYLRAIKYSFPLISGLKLGKTRSSRVQDALMRFERGSIVKNYKFGVLYAAPGQTSELQFFNNKEGSPAFERFLALLGDRIQLRGWKQFRGGLDVTGDNTGTHSVYTTLRDLEIMFHVATLMPFRSNDPQQVERKRHIGNDVVVIVFKEQVHHEQEESELVDVTSFVSNFNHVFFVVSEAGEQLYRVNVAYKPAVTPAPPYLPSEPVFASGPGLREWLLHKLVTSERHALEIGQFSSTRSTMRKSMLDDILAVCRSDEDKS